MPQVNLRKIDGDNWLACARLKVAPEQEQFVAPNVYSLAEAAYSKDPVTYYPLAVYDGENDSLVGFVMYVYDPADQVYFIFRVMIDQRYQAKGYGRAAMVALLDLLKSSPNCTEIKISYLPDNLAAEKLYESLGFRKTGEIEEGEVVSALKL